MTKFTIPIRSRDGMFSRSVYATVSSGPEPNTNYLVTLLPGVRAQVTSIQYYPSRPIPIEVTCETVLYNTAGEAQDAFTAALDWGWTLAPEPGGGE